MGYHDLIFPICGLHEFSPNSLKQPLSQFGDEIFLPHLEGVKLISSNTSLRFVTFVKKRARSQLEKQNFRGFWRYIGLSYPTPFEDCILLPVTWHNNDLAIQSPQNQHIDLCQIILREIWLTIQNIQVDLLRILPSLRFPHL